MRPRIENLDVAALEWAPLGPDGLYSKLLSFDPDTGARTALQRMNPQDGYSPPQIAHFHTTYEEILGVHGCFSFDQRTWVRPNSYVFHPPRTVHGFASAVPEDSWFLSRVGRKLDVNLVEAPTEQDLYVIHGEPPARLPCAMGDPMLALGFTPKNLADATAPVQWCALSSDPFNKEGSALVRIPDGWRFESRGLDHYLEIFTIEGSILHESHPVRSSGPMIYHFYPPHQPVGPLVACGETLAYLNFGGALPFA